ncbi:hypothetical protein SMACR_07088 [Sordaria macrospora]|uniref:WGS project CABT00000000 data, contig 2.39 n=3 Tax=Sordaria macrospora TaxID=5147 RepID=F7W7I0_SORMK|nr:uncharacterized protein SMAC_07088 [Sordaria macrospora k-hell]KAA8630126.1 hypothetical protein SMACR_07088 [Sordaria macrospora]KAH7632152.1 kinase-like domain-containing protein [Sordaria sp. MPI-SDFR-AT-0083]WPJ63432.1 hypothetical protein SMAC4_07088 [Sordaria macrospora]CCC13464.1 unnamed protein product [Sordaria macrospora k-hell]
MDFCLRNKFQSGVLLAGRYQTISPLNHGSFGMVFMARDLKTGQKVAIKCLTKKGAASEAGFDFAVDEKSEELVLHRRLGAHPNIVNFIDTFETEAHTYIVLEYCERGDLYEAIRLDQGPLETEHVRRFMLELVDAVAHIHAKGIYHRDIKPENIFLTQTGSAKLGDFGLATTEKWSYEAAVGSERYMSPEQFDSAGAGYSPAAADIWAIGICLLNVLFARNPFTTPTEADPLFLDFSRDKQSLFDVFPSMSQDTYEVIVQCMNLDPRKRSLEGAREALYRVISFTTDDEILDDFCTADGPVVASSNREPLRTPSIQSPQMDTGAFPWAKALHANPQRQLSDIPDDESYTEDLFSTSTATTSDWLSASIQTPPSVSSVMDSHLAASMQSLNMGSIAQPSKDMFAKIPVRPSVAAGSLPINMAKQPKQSALSMVFGRKDTVSKSWSDLWDEEEEEEEEHAKQLALKEMNSRTYSQESKHDEENTPRVGLSPATKAGSLHMEHDIPAIDMHLGSNIDDDLAADGFFFHDAPARKEEPTQFPMSHSPPTRKSAMDKWAALGERRRATGTTPPRGSESVPRSQRQIPHSFGAASHDFHNTNHNSYTVHSNNHSSHHYAANIGKKSTPVKQCPWSKGRDRGIDWRKEKRHPFDVEWVGGWTGTPLVPVHHL